MFQKPLVTTKLYGSCKRFEICRCVRYSMFKNLFLLPLFLLTGSLFPKFHFQLTKKAKKKNAKEQSGEWSDLVQFGR